MRLTRRAAAFVAVAFVFAGVLAATGSSSPQGGGTDLKYATSFGTFGRDAFVYVAIEKGYFREQGLNVSVVPGLGTDNARLLASGQIDYSGLGDHRQHDRPRRRRLPGQDRRRHEPVDAGRDRDARRERASRRRRGSRGRPSPTCRPRSSSGSSRSTRSAQASTSRRSTSCPGTPQTLPSLLATGRADAIGQFTVGVPTLVKAAGGRPVRTFKYSQHLKGLLGNGIVTTDQRIRTRPDEVRRFTSAILKGLNYAIQNPGESGHILQKYVPDRRPGRRGERAPHPEVLRREQVHADARHRLHRRPEGEVDGEHRAERVQDAALQLLRPLLVRLRQDDHLQALARRRRWRMAT